MLNYFLYLILYMIITTCSCKDFLLHDHNLKTFLSKKFLDVSDDLNIDVTDHLIRKKDIHENLEFISDESTRIGELESLHLLRLFNKNYISTGSSLYEIIPGEMRFVLNEVRNFTAIDNRTQFLRTIHYDNREFILSYLREGISNIYLANDIYEVRSKQSVLTRECIDAKFFVNNGDLFLITASNLGTNLAVISLYKWYGTYFDRISEALRENVNSIYTFSDGDNEVILILQDRQSLIYAVNGDRLKKVQILKGADMQHAVKFEVIADKYVMIFNENNRFILYKWRELELSYIRDYQAPIKIGKNHLSYFGNAPILFLATQKKILAYDPINFNLLANYTPEDQFVKIHEISTLNRGDKHFVYIFGRLENGTTLLNSMRFVLHSPQTEDKTQPNVLNECLTSLKHQLEGDQKFLDDMMMPFRENATEYETDNSSPVLQGSNVDFDDAGLSKKLDEIGDILDEVRANAADLFRTDEGIFDGRVTIAGSLVATTLNGGNINLNKLNSKEWSPKNWLTYNTPQIITGHTKAKHFAIQNLTMPADTIFKDILFLSGNQQIEGRLSFKSLRATELYTEEINGIDLDELYIKGDRRIVKGLKRFDLLKCANLSLSNLNRRDAFDYLKRFTATQNRRYNNSMVSIKNLEVQTINNIDWDQFSSSIFRNGTSDKISGRLTIKNLRTQNLEVSSINGVDPGNILTTSTDQNVTSKIILNSIRARNISCPDINGVDFARDVITLLDADKTVSGPVTFENLLILKDLHLNYTGSETARNNIIKNERHEMQQIYKKVKIVGNVSIENLIFQPDSTLYVSGKEFNTGDIKDKYWLKRTAQEIRGPVTIQNLAVPNLRTSTLNGVELSDYMLNDLGDKPATKFAFDNLTVLGNITVEANAEIRPNFTEINENSVKLTGSFDISGRKIFKNNLTVNAARIDVLDDIDTRDALNIYTGKMGGRKGFESLIIKGNLTAKTSYIYNINEIELNSVYQRFLSTDHVTNLEFLKMKRLTARTLTTTTLNNDNLNQFILNLDDLHSVKELKQVEITGNFTAENIRNITFLNGINFNIILNKISGDPMMMGNTRFLGDVYIKNFKVFNINNVSMRELADNLLYKHLPNHIKAKQYFKKLRTPSLISDYINNIDTRDLINVKANKSQILNLRSALRLEGPQFLKSVRGNLPCDVRQIARSIRNPPARPWSSVKILKNATVVDPQHVLSQILENSVTIGRENNITAPVSFSRITAKHVYTKRKINSVDVEEIYNDALLKSNHDELVNSTKIFKKLTAAGAAVTGDTNVTTINKLLIKKIDGSIISKHELPNTTIKGRKIFDNGLKTDILHVKTISNLDPDNLVSTSNLQPIPHASFDNLHVLHNLDIHQINGRNFTAFLESRVLKTSPSKQILTGIYYFDNITLKGESAMSSINDIKLGDVVYDDGLQIVPAPKEFEQNLTIRGDAAIDRVNGFNLSENYLNAIFMDRNAIDVENIIFEETTRIGNISAKNLNGIPIESIRAILQSETLQIKANIAHDTIDKIQTVLETNLKIAERLPTQYMYLDKYYDLDVSIPNAVRAELIDVNDHSMVHVLSEKPGYTCGLPRYCKCLVQNTIQFTPELSVHLFADKNNQRVYSYDDNSLIIHVITDSVSYSMDCRKLNTSSSAEYTTITWISKLNRHSFVFSEKIMNGYIADADFFSFANYIYIILNKLYEFESEAESYCIILRLNKATDQIEVIQKLQTTAFSVIHVHQTKHGINLIIGNSIMYKRISTYMGTTMYKFDSENQEFVIVRQINGIHCLWVKSVEIAGNNFLVLAQKNKNIAVWRYDDVQRNYFFYQNLMLDSPARTISTFNAEGAFILAVTQRENFYVYGFRYLEGWKLLSQGGIEGLRLLIPFKQNKQTYLFAPFSETSSLLALNAQGRD